MKRVLVFGGNGLLGSRLCPFLSSAGFQVFTAGRSTGLDYALDVLDFDSYKRIFDEIKPDHAINLIAITNVDQCESDIAIAAKINSLVPSLISKAAAASDAKKIHIVQISTDQVYDGTGHHMEAEVAPVNVYGLSKLAGELLTDNACTTVLRTNFYGRSLLNWRLSFSDWLVTSFINRKEFTLIKDVQFSAIHISTLCQIILKAMNSRLNGTYNLGCRNGISKADFALALAKELGLPTSAAKIGLLSDMALKARRPLDMTLKVEKIEAALGIQCPDMFDEIIKTAKEY
jgi:dTDP-4-dehydrorhamnose reductase